VICQHRRVSVSTRHTRKRKSIYLLYICFYTLRVRTACWRQVVSKSVKMNLLPFSHSAQAAHSTSTRVQRNTKYRNISKNDNNRGIGNVLKQTIGLNSAECHRFTGLTIVSPLFNQRILYLCIFCVVLIWPRKGKTFVTLGVFIACKNSGHRTKVLEHLRVPVREYEIPKIRTY
jgi:hypothetical protein